MSEGKTPDTIPHSPSATPSEAESVARPAKAVPVLGSGRGQGTVSSSILVGGSRKLPWLAKESLNAGVDRIGEAY